MFTDLVKGRKAARMSKKKSSESRDEISDARLDEIMSELFGEDDDEAQASRKVKKGAREDLAKAMEDEDESDDLEKAMEDEDEDEDLEKGMSRREMMNQVYSMVDDLSDQELDKFLSDRQIKKAQIMAIFEQMPTSDLVELVSARDANGSAPMSPIPMVGKGHGYDQMMMDKGHGYGDKNMNPKMMKADEDEDEDLFSDDDEM